MNIRLLYLENALRWREAREARKGAHCPGMAAAVPFPAGSVVSEGCGLHLPPVALATGPRRTQTPIEGHMENISPELMRVLLILPTALLGLTLHELAHGLTAYALGDPTAKQQGRLTLNPLKHLDPFGTLLLVVFHFGWAKPVQVNPGYFPKPKLGLLLVALAGPLTNLALAVALGLGVRALAGAEESLGMLLLYQLCLYGVLINVALAVFNLLPIPPLDGSRLIYVFVPDRAEALYRRIERVSMMVLMGVLLLGALSGTSTIGRVLWPVVNWLLATVAGVQLG